MNLLPRFLRFRKRSSKDQQTIDELLELLEEIIQNIDIPEARCTCFISPPCNDCVTYSYIRELVSTAELRIKTLRSGAKDG